mgnify:CR=1 FL=1
MSPRASGATGAPHDLARLLALIPRLPPFEPRRVGDVAAELGLAPAAVLRLVRQLETRGEELAGYVDPVRILVEPDGDDDDGTPLADRTLELQASSHFLRPMRLTTGELHALELGLAMLAGDCAPDEEAAIAEARARLRELLVQRPRDAGDARTLAPPAGPVEPIAARLRGTLATLRRARLARRAVECFYQAGEAVAAVQRVVHPWALVTASGEWYCIAWCTRSGALRNFRLDRMASVALTDIAYDIPDDFSPTAVLAEGTAFVGAAPATCTIRYTARIAPWLRERHDVALDADGALTVRLPLADTDWAVRHVLQYAGEAEALEPPALRAAIAARVSALLAGD